jgi:hypothetical protein
MKNIIITEFIKETGFVIKGLIDAGYTEQFSRIAFELVNDFFLAFPKDKQFFAVSSEQGGLKYYAFDNEALAKKAIAKFKKMGDMTAYRIVSRTIAEMAGRELEFYQYIEITAPTDEEAEIAHQKQQGIIDFLFSAK